MQVPMIVEQVRRKGDWLLYVLLLGAVLCLPLAIGAASWVPEGNRLIYVAFWGSLAGLIFAHTRLPDLLAWLLGIALGVEYSVQFAGKLLPELGWFLGDIGKLIGWLWQVAFSRTISNLPVLRGVPYMVLQTKTMIANLSGWLAMVQSGGTSRDNTLLWFGVALTMWVLSWNAGFELFRSRRTFLALLPLGVGVVANVSFTDIGTAYLNVFMGITLVTLVWANIGRMEALWTRLGVDTSPEVKRDAAFAGVALAAIIFLMAMFMPYITSGRVVWWFWDNYGPTFKTFYKQLDRAFAGRNPVPEPTKSVRKGLVAHDIRSGGTPGKEVILLVHTSDPPPLPDEDYIRMGRPAGTFAEIPRHYWRERSYDIYTGHGWDSSARKLQPAQANTPWNELDYPHTVLTQTFQFAKPGHELVYAVNQPLKVDQDYGVWARKNDDLAALTTNALTYTVVSWIPDATVDELQKAEGDYPDWVKERYLPLPDIPERVRQMAQEVTQQANATTRYDKARAIETYLRNFPYDLNLEPPPLDADVVDYFLFTAKRGYCDYSATAMVVMLRSIGVAARYASGYNMGHYDFAQGAWAVTEENAHAWAEVYFPGYGWIEFEPTPTQQVFIRNVTRLDSDAANLPATTAPERKGIPPLWIGGGALMLVLLFVIIWPPRWFAQARRTPRKIIFGVYERVVGQARWLGIYPWAGQTPREYLRVLAQEVEGRAHFAEGTAQELKIIDQAYQRARYSEETLTYLDGHRAEDAWRRLRLRFLRLLFVRVRRQTEDTSQSS